MTGQPYDAAALASELSRDVGAIVAKQAELGIDVMSDGEFSKTSFQYYVTDRLSGLEPITPKPGVRATRENRAFPVFYKGGAHSGTQATRFACTGPIRYVGHAQLAADIANFKAALAGAPHVDAFMPSVSPSSCVGLMENRHYKNDEEHVHAVAEALREEYLAIVEAGFLLQIDDPRLAMHYMLSPGEGVDDARAWARRRIEALNHALRGIPPERVRHHTCYGINMGPRTSDFELKHLADLIVTIRAELLFLRDGEPAPRARMAGVGDGEASRRQGAGAGLHHPGLGRRRASRARRRAYRPPRRRGRPRAGDGEHRLRLRLDAVRDRAARDRAGGRVGEAREPRRRRAARERDAVAVRP